MGPFFNKKRLQNPVQRTSNSVARPNLLPAASKSAAGRGSRQSSFKGGSGGNNPGLSRLLLLNFPSSQEERETQADHRPLCAQPFCLHRDIQNGDTEKSEKRRSAERLGVFIGSDGRLFAYPDTSSVSQIPQIHVERSSVPVQGTPIRPLDKSFRVYTPYDCHSDIPKEKGYNSTSLSRRLVSSKPKPSKTVGTQTIHYVTDQFTRSDNQLREIRPSSSSSVHFHRDGVSDPYQYRQSTSSQANEDIGFSQNILTENLCISQRFPVPLGTSLLGQLNATADFVMLGRLHLRPLQMSLHNQWQPQKFPLCHQIGITTKILQHLKWWLQEDLYCHGIPMKIDPPSHTIFTDASLSGWGAHVEPEGLLFHGLWTEDQSQLHINVLEMKAIFLSLTRAVHKVKNSTVLVSTDNTTVVAYIRHQGGTHSTVLSEEVWNILNLCLAHNIQLLAKHIPGRFNTLADRMSQIDKPISTEWSLNQEIANKIFQIMDFPSIDLFATRLNHRLPLYVSPIPDQKALSIDAISMDWNHTPTRFHRSISFKL